MLQVPQAFRNLLKDAENWHLAPCADLKMDSSHSHLDAITKAHPSRNADCILSDFTIYVFESA